MAKPLNYNACVISRTVGFYETRIVRDRSKFPPKVIQIKIPGGMEEKYDSNPVEWNSKLRDWLTLALFSEEQISVICYFEKKLIEKGTPRTQQEYGAIREQLEETGIYVFKIKHLFYHLQPAKYETDGTTAVHKNWFFGEEYILPLKGDKKFISPDRDVEGAAWVCVEELLTKGVSNCQKIISSHYDALKASFERKQISKEITVADML